ncbi:MAG: hypothetical protein ACE5MK_11200 [Acidobacteriota bacterium]
MVDFHSQHLSNRPLNASNRATYSEIIRWITFGALFVSLIVVYAWSHNEILNTSYRMEQLRRENNELSENNAALRAEHSSLINPESIDHVARKIGLVTSNRADVKILDSHLPMVKPSENLVAQSTLQKKTLHE